RPTTTDRVRPAGRCSCRDRRRRSPSPHGCRRSGTSGWVRGRRADGTSRSTRSSCPAGASVGLENARAAPPDSSPMTLTPDDHYPIISADCHAGANHETYRSYLEAKYLDDFDAWREKYRNPFRDLQKPGKSGRVRNWDNEVRLDDLHADGQVAEVIFPNTVPP